jgi:hypothetical protein
VRRGPIELRLRLPPVTLAGLLVVAERGSHFRNCLPSPRSVAAPACSPTRPTLPPESEKPRRPRRGGAGARDEPVRPGRTPHGASPRLRREAWSLPARLPPQAAAAGGRRPVNSSGQGGGGTPPGSPAIRGAPRLRRFHPNPMQAPATLRATTGPPPPRAPARFWRPRLGRHDSRSPTHRRPGDFCHPPPRRGTRDRTSPVHPAGAGRATRCGSS